MFKGFQDTSKLDQFNGFPNLNFNNNPVYGFGDCIFWFDAAYGLNTQTDGAAISYWRDRIGNVKFTQSSAGSQPSYKASLAAFNNNPAINASVTGTRFLDYSDHLISGTIVIIHQETTQASSINRIVTGSGYCIASRKTSSAFGVYVVDAGYPSDFVSSIRDLNAHIYIVTKNDIVIDGVLDSTGGNSTVPAFNSIGASGAGTCHKGYIGEIIGYKYQMTSDEMIKLSDKINAKYAIY